MNGTSLRPYLWMLLGSLAFALMGTLTHELGDRLDWQTIAVARSVVPLVVMVLLALSTGVRLVFFRPRVLWMRSIAGSLSMICTFYALTKMPTEDVFTLTNTFPLWIAVLSGPLLGERIAGSVWLAIGCGLAGVALILRPHFATGNLAVLAALCAAFFTAFAMIGLHRLRGLDSKAIVAHFSAVALLFNAAALLGFGQRHEVTELSSTGLAMLFGVGASATIGQLLLTWAFVEGSPARVSVVGLMQVPFAILWGALLSPVAVDPWKLLGMPLVLVPAAWLMLQTRMTRKAPIDEAPALDVDGDGTPQVDTTGP